MRFLRWTLEVVAPHKKEIKKRRKIRMKINWGLIIIKLKNVLIFWNNNWKIMLK